MLRNSIQIITQQVFMKDHTIQIIHIHATITADQHTELTGDQTQAQIITTGATTQAIMADITTLIQDSIAKVHIHIQEIRTILTTEIIIQGIINYQPFLSFKMQTLQGEYFFFLKKDSELLCT